LRLLRSRKAIAELDALIKAHPNLYSFASAGVGQTGHRRGEDPKVE
jgi:hypothetical protein